MNQLLYVWNNLLSCFLAEWYPPGNGLYYKVFNPVIQSEANQTCVNNGARLASTGIRNRNMKKLVKN